MRTSQEKALHALQSYTLSHYPGTPAKFGELLLRIPELQRTCQVSGLIELFCNCSNNLYYLIPGGQGDVDDPQ